MLMTLRISMLFVSLGSFTTIINPVIKKIYNTVQWLNRPAILIDLCYLSHLQYYNYIVPKYVDHNLWLMLLKHYVSRLWRNKYYLDLYN